MNLTVGGFSPTEAVFRLEEGTENNLSDSITFPAEIKDVRHSYGRLDYQITPVDGEGLIWVSAERVKLTTKEA